MSMSTKLQISHSRSGQPCLGVGGGGSSNTFRGRFIVRDNGLPPALFVRSRGDLANSEDQAVVAVQLGDLVVSTGGRRPVKAENPDIWVTTHRITAILANEVEIDEFGPVDPFRFPSVISGLATYHNRDGSHFVAV